MSDTSSSRAEAKRRPSPARPKVPPFARYKGTSAWRKDRRRVRAYARFLAEAKLKGQGPGAPGA